MRSLWPGLCLICALGCASEERWGDYAPPIDAGEVTDSDLNDARSRERDMALDLALDDMAAGDMAPPDGAPPAVDQAPPDEDARPPEPDMAPDPDARPPEPDMAPPALDMAPDARPPERDMAPPERDMAPPEPDMAPPEPDMAPPQVCADGDQRAVGCGLNGRGAQAQRCVADAWVDDGPCDDPDRCEDGLVEVEPCGLNDRGTRRRVCAGGDFGQPEDCVDPDECADGDGQARACGDRGDGEQTRSCALGAWMDWSGCVGACADDCAAGESRCVGDAVEVCEDVDDDPCLEWGPPAVCPPDVSCVGGVCEAPPGGIIINEVYYDQPSGDGTAVFIELWGPPGAAVDGLALIGINGANGLEYVRVELAGAVGDDGYYLAATPDAEPALAALADLFDAAVDLQNGPDNLQLIGPAGVLDAVAYGNVGEHFFGETAGTRDVPAGSALTRIDHVDTDDNSVDFATRPPSPRAEPE